jgi:hypothetical protein
MTMLSNPNGQGTDFNPEVEGSIPSESTNGIRITDHG